jgi:polyketide synthase PksN
MPHQESLLELTESYLKALFRDTLDLPAAEFDSSTPFGELGVDSFRVLKLIKALEADFGTLPKTLLFENFNIGALAQYFVDQHAGVVSAKFPAPAPARPAQAQVHAPAPAEAPGPAPAAPAPVPAAPRAQPLRLLERNLPQHPELQAVVEALFERHKNEGCVSRGTRNIAPNLFVGSAQKGYFNYSRSGSTLLVYAYTGPQDYLPEVSAELYRYCAEKKFQLNIFTDQAVPPIDGVAFSATPFGALQRVLDLQSFTLEGGAMRRLRYQVSKFEKAGTCRTCEYRCGTDPAVDQAIAAVIDRWCETKTMVNPLIHIVRQEIIAGTLHRQHRVFLTYLDDVLQNVILVSAMSREINGYLMDLEFYSKDMPLGGLEYAIVKIIEALAAEGCDMLSLGGTYGCRLGSSDNADPAVDKLLDELHTQGIFNDESNLQFKNKFRPENRIIYLCRPVGSGKADNVIDIIMMIADPAKAQTSDEANHNVGAAAPAAAEAAAPEAVEAPAAAPAATGPARVIAGADRSRTLLEAGFNPLNLPSAQVDFDLKTDSWAQLDAGFVHRQMQHLHAQLQQPAVLNDSLRAIFPFKHFLLTDAGRSAERVLYKAWPRRGIVLQNLLFFTGLYHQIDQGFSPCEIPDPTVFRLDADESFKGNLSWEALQEQVARRGADIAFVCIETSDNAAGGQPVSLEHLGRVKALLGRHGIPLVIDATRVLESAYLLIEREPQQAGKSLWDVAAAILAHADVVVGALSKDFCVSKGGLIATNDEALLRRFQDVLQQDGGGLDVIDKKLIALSLQNRRHIETQVLRRMAAARSIWQALVARQVPVVRPAGGHCVLVDVKRIPELAGFKHPVASFLAWLYLNTGIRAGAHGAGMQKDGPLNGLVRLAVPVGLKQEEADEIAARLVRLFDDRQNLPELASTAAAPDVHARYTLVRYHRPSGAVVDEDADADAKTQVQAAAAPQPAATPAPPAPAQAATPIPAPAQAPASGADAKPAVAQRARGDIAIVGMAGRYPKARNLDEFWDNLRRGRDCVGDMPQERLAQRARHAFTRDYRGGFLEDVDRFDSLFFNISPREAEVLDPQERLFLEVAWEAIEDAGYYPEILAEDKAPRQVGVFVGAVWAMYQMAGVEGKLAGRDVNPNSFLWSIANRVSYWMNLTGPSLTVDTACSSSLTALYLACEAIHDGDCTSALVGGVNLDLHQHKFDINWAGGALSADGVCRSFGAGANGYVAGEGVGALFLKPLEQALRDRDQVYGVIRGVAVNHGGRTSGYTVPNPRAQGELVAQALRKAGVDARSIGYVEAHGTGTELGDPIEISGLTTAFGGDGANPRSCPIGSVKTNIGHLEAAAGVVGLCKVLLQMKYGQLVPSLHSARLNEHIDFGRSPFYVQQQLEPWQPREIDGVRVPLRAGISSFGAGGANAHVVVEAHGQAPSLDAAQDASSGASPDELRIFPLAARNDEQLREAAARLLGHLQRDFVRDRLADIAFTLQRGRKPFEHRAAILARSRQELADRLQALVDGRKDADVLCGHAKNAQGITRLLNRHEKEQFVAMLSQGREPHKLAQLWIDGLLDDCHGFPQAGGRRTSLPTYPFADKRHWIGSAAQPAPALSGAARALHPLIDSNDSTFQRQLFSKTFHAHEFFLRDHVVSGIPTLPGTAYLDAARKAGEIAAGRPVRAVRNVTWTSPLAVAGDAPLHARIELKPAGDSVAFEMFSEPAGGPRKLYAQGKLVYADEGAAAPAPEQLDLAAIRARATRTLTGQEAYPLFQSVGLGYGRSFQLLQQVWQGEDEVLGLLQLPDVRAADFDQFVLHPCILDAAMQAGVAAQLAGATGDMKVPYSIGEVELLGPLPRTCYSHVTRAKSDRPAGSGVSRENVTLTDETGRVLARLRDCVGVPLASVHEKPAPAQKPQDGPELLYYAPAWHPAPLNGAPQAGGPVLLFDTGEQLWSACRARGVPALLVTPGTGFEDLGQDRYTVRPQERGDHERLFEALGRRPQSVQKVCFAWPQADEPADAGALAQALERGVHAFLPLCQALLAQKSRDRVQLLYLHRGGPAGAPAHNDAINGFVRSLRLEHPKVDAKVVEVGHADAPDAGLLADVVLAELDAGSPADATVRYEGSVRQVRALQRLDAAALAGAAAPGLALKQQGVYLITGGAGGLGWIFAEHLAAQCQARLVLTGRSRLDAQREAQLDQLRALGAQVLYVAADIANADDVQRLLGEARAAFGALHGIVHGAGVLRDSLLRNKTRDEMDAVLAPKVYGSFHLDRLTRDDPLDFFVLFSSLAAVGGNAGQCDYAFANHYMDSFAAAREQWRAAGQRAGRTVSINWSLWADGGMKLDEQTELFFRKNLGISPLRTHVGLQAFNAALAQERPQIAVLEGVPAKIERAWGMEKPQEPVAAPADASAAAGAGEADAGGLEGPVIQALSQKVMEMLKLAADDLSLDSILLDLGFDSIGLTTFANAINELYRLDVSPVLFFEYPSIRAIAGALVAQHREQVLQVHGAAAPAAAVAAAPAASAPAAAAPAAPDRQFAIRKGVPADPAGTPAPAPAPPQVAGGARGQRFASEPIAIVGIGGAMPQSHDLQEFWDHLEQARNLVTEVPRDRWRWEDYDGNPVKEVNKSNSRWGGFLKEVDKFDPLFFGITPREAEMMDPQQRLFIETVWSAIEDSGHKVSDLAGTRTGVFVGVSAKDYIDVIAANASSLDGYSAAGNSHSILANRISYLFNLRGPSAPLDTACSSSLIALHRAIESIHTGSCEMAIVGGVQVMLTPVGHVSLSSAGMLSPDGKCKTFDKQANGYVRGEGAGAVFVKPLSRAVADGNPIYAVVRATAENHGGRVTMLTAPNPKAQAELLFEAYDQARIDPASVGYIECHGTGTSLGDPIEIQALKKSFSDLYQRHGKAAPAAPHCGLSSVKTNIGHLEPAAGIASLLKVLLAMKHRRIPAMLHFEELNPYIDLAGTPFYIVDRTTAWEAPRAADGSQLPRRAGVSSFGWGGANAHVVLEEHVAPAGAADGRAEEADGAAQLVLLSARNADRLKAYAAALLAHLGRHEVMLADLAYTLQVGRDAMDERLALVVDSAAQLAQRLQAVVDGAEPGPADGVYRGRVARGKRPGAAAAGEPLARLAQAWVQGADLEANPAAGAGRRRRISLPTYPFARERYWIQAAPGAKPAAPAGPSAAAAAAPGVAVLQSPEVRSLLARPVWERSPVAAAPRGEFQRHRVLLCGPQPPDLARLQALTGGAELMHLPAGGGGDDAAGRYGAVALACFEQLQALLRGKPRGRTLFQVVAAADGEEALLAGLSGLLDSARQEHPQLVGQVILIGAHDHEAHDEKTLAQQLLACGASPAETLFRYEQGTRSLRRWRLQQLDAAGPGAQGPGIALREHGVYLVTGGLGGLGGLFAQEILQRAPRAKVVLTGRSALTPQKQDALSRLCATLGVPAEQLSYRVLDPGRPGDAEALVAQVLATHGALHGVIHSAGMTRDSLIVNKTPGDFADVLAPKVAGTVHLDRATRDVDLDFLALFSSVSAALGNAGQADYAAANGFMDQFAAYRNRLAAGGRRRGHTLSINWPLWEEGGMQIDARAKARLLKATGMLPMRTPTGLRAFHRSLELQAGQALVMEGQRERLEALLPRVSPIGEEQVRRLQQRVLADLRSFQARGA